MLFELILKLTKFPESLNNLIRNEMHFRVLRGIYCFVFGKPVQLFREKKYKRFSVDKINMENLIIIHFYYEYNGLQCR